MNNIEFEKILSKNGFSAKDIRSLRKHAGLNGATYPSLLHELKWRFIVSLILIVILLIGLVLTAIFDDKVSIISYCLTMVIAAPMFYVFTPMRLGYKSFFFKN